MAYQNFQLTKLANGANNLIRAVSIRSIEVDKEQSVSSEGLALASGERDIGTLDIGIVIHPLEQSQTTVKEPTDRHGKNRVTERIRGIRPNQRPGPDAGAGTARAR
jgi:hypothetical protein